MKAGELNDSISVYRLTRTMTEYGSQEETLEHVFDVRAKVVVGNGFRSVINNEIVYSVSHYFTVRCLVNALPDDVVVYQGKKYRVISVKLNKEEQSKELTTEEINE